MTWDPKLEAVRLWNADPCGSAAGTGAEGTAEFFGAIDRDRYVRYAPWLPATAEFTAHPGALLLEVGCGMGTDLASFARGGAATVAVDLTPRHLSIARQRLEHERKPVRLVRSDGEVLPFADDTFDLVYSFGVLHHTPGTATAIDEIRRVLKPRGVAIVGLYHRDSVNYWYYTLFIRGVLWGGLFRGYRQLLADIERHDRSEAVPLVKVYSRRQMRRLFSRFSSVDVGVHHLTADDFTYFARMARALPKHWIGRAARRWGWYVVARAIK